MTKRAHPIPVVTFLVSHQDEFLLVRRPSHENKFLALWGFLGGKVEVGETIIEAIQREAKEELGMKLLDKFLFLNSYIYSDSVGLQFALISETKEITSSEFEEYAWLKTVEDMQKYPRIPGIDYHVKQFLELKDIPGAWRSLKGANYTVDKYLNR